MSTKFKTKIIPMKIFILKNGHICFLKMSVNGWEIDESTKIGTVSNPTQSLKINRDKRVHRYTIEGEHTV